MGIFRILYIDRYSFYASVEQQLNLELRGRPVGITAVDGGIGAIVAASYDAKALGIGVGTRVGYAKRICPGIALIGARHRVYKRMNRKIELAVRAVVEIERVRSIDEFQARLSDSDSEFDRAIGKAREVKNRIRIEAGPMIGCSIGLGLNHLLTKNRQDLNSRRGLVSAAANDAIS